MALESVSAAETAIQSNNDDTDLEDGEIPSDEDDDPVPVLQTVRSSPEPPKSSLGKTESPKHKFDNSRRSSSIDKLNRHKSAASDDFAGDVEKAIRAALDEDRGRKREDNKDSRSSKSKDKSSKNRNRKRSHEKEEERSRDQKKKKLSDEENINDDDDEMLFVRGASPTRRGSRSRENSPFPRRHDQDNYNSGSDYDDRSSPKRHRDDKRGGARSNRRNVKAIDRGGKNKGRTVQLRNERNNGRRNHGNDQSQDPDAICVYYMQGKCHRGDDCPFSHNALPPRKMELCKFYLMDCCAKRDKCLYMHHDFPCKFFHTGLKCNAGENCKFSHQPMSEQVKNILLKHLETAPKEILGNFPRLSREGAMHLINKTEKQLAQGQEALVHKIPSLFELKVPTLDGNVLNDHGRDDGDDHKNRDKKSAKKTRWGSDDDRVPYDMLVNQFGLQLGNNKDKSTAPLNFYSENEKKEKDPKDNLPKSIENVTLSDLPKDVDLRQLLTPKAHPQVVSIADEVAKSKTEEESDRDEDTGLVIEMSVDEDNKEKKSHGATNSLLEKAQNSPSLSLQEIPANLPKKTQELYMRIQQQQREQQESFKNLENNENQQINQDDWYSDDDNDDDDDDDDDQLTIDVKEAPKEIEDEEDKFEVKEQLISEPSSFPQPAPIVEKLGDVSKIDISMEVSKLLSTIKAQSSAKKEEKEVPKVKKETSTGLSDLTGTQPIKTEHEHSDSRLSPSRITASTTPTSQTVPISRDPRMSRDPRQRRDDQRPPTISNVLIPPKSESKDSRPLRLETSIYSSGIIAEDAIVDTDLRARLDQDHRRKDMDLRCFSAAPSFGDTDLRMVGAPFSVDTSKSGDVDLRMLSLSFKPVPSHVPCTEIDAGITSHPPISFKVYVIDIPRPDYTGLKITRNDPQVQYDPRLRRILRLSKDDIADSPMSPPPVKMLDTPKSPPLVRADPRRKALEAAQPKIIPTTVQQHPIQENPAMPGMPMGMNQAYMQTPTTIPTPLMSNMGPTPLMMTPTPMVGNMGQMMSGNGGAPMVQPMRDNMRMSGMGPPSSNMQQHPGGPQNQMNQYDPRFQGQRNSGVGLLGAGPQQMSGYNQDPRSAQFDGPPGRYQGENYGGGYGNQPERGFGKPPERGFGNPSERGFGNPSERGFGNPPERGFGPNGQHDDSNFGNSSDWNGGPGRMNRRDRRRGTRGKFGGLSRKKD